jgi:hypothetical protein
MRKITIELSQDSWSEGRYLNPGPPKYEAGQGTVKCNQSFMVSQNKHLKLPVKFYSQLNGCNKAIIN